MKIADTLNLSVHRWRLHGVTFVPADHRIHEGGPKYAAIIAHTLTFEDIRYLYGVHVKENV